MINIAVIDFIITIIKGINADTSFAQNIGFIIISFALIFIAGFIIKNIKARDDMFTYNKKYINKMIISKIKSYEKYIDKYFV
ncbi:hypothetical protein [Kineothrix alysoides]|nr:hypothetical protein [Kineothrix alysoides]